MTAQVHDTVVWMHQDYSLVGVQGGRMFQPLDHGVETRPTTTANWRGWVARYVIDDDRLLLAELHDVGLPALSDEDAPTINGVAPVREGRGSFSYPELDLPVPFTGQLLIAHGFIQSLYRHMGFHPAWKYEHSWELDLVDGLVTKARDVSDEMARIRERMRSDPTLDPDHESKPGWIGRTFSLVFRKSKG